MQLYFKRDDLTGAGLGGNKLRGLEFLVADALARGCDSLVTGAGPQSNWTMLAALACLRCGIEPHVVVLRHRPRPGRGQPAAASLAGRGRTVHRVGASGRRWTRASRRSPPELRAAGRRPYPVPRGGATPLGALGYLRASLELAAQLAGLDEPPAGLWLATGSCGTQAGLLAGAALTGAAYQVVGVTVSRPADECRHRVGELAAAAAALTGLDTAISAPEVRDGWIGPGYGVPSAAGQAAARLVAVTEGVFLDPVFGAKAMAALIAEARAGRLYGPQVFLVSGGAPTLFAGTALDGPADRAPPGAGALDGDGAAMTGVPPPEGYLGTSARITSGPAPELVEAGYELEIGDAPLLHRGLTVADLAHLTELVECAALTRDEAAPVAAVLLEAAGHAGRRLPLRPGVRRRVQQPGAGTRPAARPGGRVAAPGPDPPRGRPHRVPAGAAGPAAEPAR